MCSLLIVLLLVIETSSARPAIEQPSRGFGDSLQFCWNERGAWQVRTRALDYTVEVQALSDATPEAVERAADAARAACGSTLLRAITLSGADSRATMRSALRRQHLSGIVEGPDDAHYAYWAPVPFVYRQIDASADRSQPRVAPVKSGS